MLVLSRRKDETIVLPELNLTIRIASIAGNRVRLAVEAPRSVNIVRHEVAERNELARAADVAGRNVLV